MQPKITIFTDGSSRGNPGPGGWGALIIDTKHKVVELSGREDKTTNNRMELSAARAALEYIEQRKLEGDIELHTDSAYLLQGVTGWMYGWEKNGWKTKTGEDVLNQDIWKDLGALMFRLKQKHSVELVKVAGHAGLLGNERADELATAAADGRTQMQFTGSLKDYEKMIGGSVFSGMTDETLAKKKRSSAHSGKAAFSYVSMIGGLIAVHQSWAQCEARVKGKAGAKFKKVFSQGEEDLLINEWTNSTLPRRS